ncbi:MAG TPA: hypothetical protein ENN58_03825, partial [bacterium]|nr:hypothetical protein [bacterium]
MGIKEKIKEIYEKKYKLLLLIPLTLLFIAIIINIAHVANTGDIINKGVSLGGGTSITVYTDANYKDVEAFLKNEYGAANVDVKNIAGQQGFIVDGASEINSEELLQKIFSITGELAEENYSMEKTGESLGKSFFQEIFRAILVAFLFMGFVVFLYFGHGTKAKVLSF